jgi:hypothetical protein
MGERDNFIFAYIYLAVGSGFLGVVLTFLLLGICQYYAVDIYKNIWLLLIPLLLAITLNICFIELYRKYKKK